MEKITLSTPELQAEVWTLGAAVNDVRVADRDGKVASVILGYDTEEQRLQGISFLGEIVGPVANRIGEGGYDIDGVHYSPRLNDRDHAVLHGGDDGFHRQEWTILEQTETLVRLGLDWEASDGSFPGPIHVQVEYEAFGSDLSHRITATADQPTNLNIVSHPYFNLSGTLVSVCEHTLEVPAARYLPIDAHCIPFPDAPYDVEGSDFDLRVGREFCDLRFGSDPQIIAQHGLDHAYILEPGGFAGRLIHPPTGRVLNILSDYPALQVYTGQGLGHAGVTHPVGKEESYVGVALETEEYPDAPRRPDFPSILVRPGETYRRATTWRFSTQP
ncbi:MAG: galactose mutarotase [Propionibacteriaceae bacterium]|jgi:aldose 1-epimerase|nr:galactose mutarotase [Propionibacteriaceae bacterium]